MKKILVLLLAMLLVVSLAACVGTKDEADDVFNAIEDYLESDEFEENSKKWADEIESLLQ